MQGFSSFLRRAFYGHHHKAARKLVAALRRDHPDALLCRYLPDGRLQTTTINAMAAERGRPFVILMTPLELRLYPVDDAPGEPLTFGPEALRWFGRPDKYHAGRNSLWLHVQQAGGWQLVQMEPYYAEVTRLIRALKAFAPSLETAYRRRRPYVHFGPLAARQATQDLYGVWTLHEAVSLYLMPLHLVLLDGTSVQSTIPVETVTHVRGVQRMDAAGGVVRFQTGEETHAFAVDDYRGLAHALAEAARRSLEQPLEMLEGKRKKKKSE